MTGAYTIKALTPSTWDAFARLVRANNCIYGGCWCMSFHAKDKFHADDLEQNCWRKYDRVNAGTAHAALVFVGEYCVGWCQFGSPDELPRIKSLRAYEKELVDLADWRIACCFVGKGHRCPPTNERVSPSSGGSRNTAGSSPSMSPLARERGHDRQ